MVSMALISLKQNFRVNVTVKVISHWTQKYKHSYHKLPWLLLLNRKFISLCWQKKIFPSFYVFFMISDENHTRTSKSKKYFILCCLLVYIPSKQISKQNPIKLRVEKISQSMEGNRIND